MLDKRTKRSIYACIGASNHVKEDRQIEDYYATSPEAVTKLLEVEKFNKTIVECAVGEGHIAKELWSKNHIVVGFDIIDRGFYNTIKRNYLSLESLDLGSKFDVITNPPYKYALEFVLKSLELVEEGCKVAMLLKLTFLEGQKRRLKLFNDNPPYKLYVFSKRTICAKNGDFTVYNSSAVAYGWFVWIKGYEGDTIIEWI